MNLQKQAKSMTVHKEYGKIAIEELIDQHRCRIKQPGCPSSLDREERLNRQPPL